MAAGVRPYRGVSAEDRRARQRARLIDAALAVLVGGVAEAIRSWLDGTLVMSRDLLVEQCARLAVAAADAVGATAV